MTFRKNSEDATYIIITGDNIYGMALNQFLLKLDVLDKNTQLEYDILEYCLKFIT